MRSRPLVGAAGSLLSAVLIYGYSPRLKDECGPPILPRSVSLRSDKTGTPLAAVGGRFALLDPGFVRTSPG